MRIVCGPWRSAPLPPGSGQLAYWPPVGATGAIDLSADTPGSHGLFVVPDAFVSGDHLLLGRGPNDAVSASKRQSFAAWLGLAAVPTADRVLPLIAQVMTEHAEPDMGGGRNPLEPTHEGDYELRLGPMTMPKRRFHADSEVGWDRLRTRLRNDYRRIKSHDEASAAKWASAMRRKLRVPFHEVADAGDRERDPTTTITDNFNRLDNPLALGVSAELWAWLTLSGAVQLASNQARSVTLNSDVLARAESDLSSSDHYAQALLGASEEINPAFHGTLVRKDSTLTFTYYYCFASFQDNMAYLLKNVAGATTVLGSAAYTFTAGTTYTGRTSAIGSAVAMLVGGVSVVAVTDTAVTGNLRTGIQGQKNTLGYVSWDDYVAADVVAAAGDLLLRLHNEGLYVGATT